MIDGNLQTISRLDYENLSKQGRYGIVKFQIEFVFELGLLRDYIIPIGIKVSNPLLNQYDLLGVSEKFEPYFGSIGEMPRYDVYFHFSNTTKETLVEIIKL